MSDRRSNSSIHVTASRSTLNPIISRNKNACSDSSMTDNDAEGSTDEGEDDTSVATFLVRMISPSCYNRSLLYAISGVLSTFLSHHIL